VTKAFVVQSLDYGLRDISGKALPPNKAGKSLGFDLDGKCTSKADPTSRACRSVELSTLKLGSFFGTFAEGFNDGEGCLDNVFGGVIFPVINTAGRPDFDEQLNNSVNSVGVRTVIFVLEDVDATVDDTYAPANVYFTTRIEPGKAPDWTTTGSRIIDYESIDLVGPDKHLLTDAEKHATLLYDADPSTGSVPAGYQVQGKIRFPNGYIAGNTWVSGPFDPQNNVTETQPSALLFGGARLDVPLKASLISLEFYDESHDSVKKGMYGGLMSSADLKTALPGLLHGLCIDYSQIDKAFGADSVAELSSLGDASSTPPFFVAPDVDCDTLSIGIGMTLVPTKLPYRNDQATGTKTLIVGHTDPPSCASSGKGGAAGAGGAGGAAGAAGAGGAAGKAGAGGAAPSAGAAGVGEHAD
jgi:hypothetical protein